MIHEVMVLDHSGPDLGFIEYTQALKLWIFSQLVVNLALTVFALPAMVTLVVYVLGTFLMAICIGLIESMMARIHFLRVPRLIFGAAVIASLSVLIEVA